jgi:ribonuclease Z
MLDVKILGTPSNDNALWVTVSSGQASAKLLFDCGADVLQRLSLGDIQAIDHLFLSHLHMDHISGFDAFFRVNFSRSNRKNVIWGPPGTAAILQHRFQGFWRSHAHEIHATWYVNDISASQIHSYRFEANEAFAVMHDEGERDYQSVILEDAAFNVEAVALRHHGISLGYIVREKPRLNVDQAALQRLGLRPGAWLAALKAGLSDDIEIGGINHDAPALRRETMTEQAGDCVAYMTDFMASDEERIRIAPYLKGVETLYAEAQYAPRDIALAEKYQHSTVEQIAELAKLGGVENYTLLHLSRRYSRQEWVEMLAAAQTIFPSSRYINEWNITAG